MRKELVISSTRQETRIAVLENDELVEFLIERHRSQNIAGNIYKGRVTKVLPGMQSAFVNIGLERDAFLYVSDFFEDTDEYERVVATAEKEALEVRAPGAQPARPESARPSPRSRVPKAEKPVEAEAPESDEPAAKAPERRGSRRRGERRDKKGRIPSFESQGSDESQPQDRPEPRDREPPEPRDRSERRSRSGGRSQSGLQLLPGETLAKYRDDAAESGSDPSETDAEADLERLIGEFPTEESMPIDDLEAAITENALPEELDSGVDAVDTAEEAASPGEPDVAGSSEASESGADEGDPEPLSSEEEVPEVAESTPAEEAVAARDADGDGAARDADEAGAAGDADGDDDEDSDEGEQADDPTTGTAKITERKDEGRFTRKPPTRRPRRRGPAKSESGHSDGPRSPMISDLLSEGQEILVQVSKEPLGKKGARITSHIALPGRYLVYMPTVDHIGVSRKIPSDDERARLRRIINDNREGLPGGFIVRTAGDGKDEKEFIQDIRFLGNLWKDIRQKSEKSSGGTLIHSDLNLVQRVLRDQLSDEFKAIRLDNEVEYARVLEFVNNFQPSLVNRVRLHVKDTPIFEEFGLQQEIEKALRPKVWLRSGGYIVVNQTEALVAIDVNTGKFVGKSNRLEDTIVRTNMDAAHEIVRQVRLRNLGGIIVVDFIDMEERKNRQRVMVALEEELRKDRSPSKILQFNDFGLVAITRKRTQPSLERILGSACPRCGGSGYVKAVETICYEIQQELKKMLTMIDGDEIIVRANSEVAKALKSGDFVDLTEMEEETRKDILVKGDPLLQADHFDIS